MNTDNWFDTKKAGDFVAHHGGRLFASVVTGVFTWWAGNYFAGWFVGIVWVVLAEGMGLYWPFKLESAQTVKVANKVNLAAVVQWASAIAGIVIAILSIIATDLSSAVLIAQKTHALTGALAQFAFTPAWADKIVVYTLPVLAFAHGILLTVFYIASPEAAHVRELRTVERESNRSIAIANAKAKKAQAEAQAEEFERIAIDKAREKGKALARLDAERRYGIEEDHPS